MSVEIIVARARNGVIGGGNRMLCHVPQDFAFFKSTTMGSPVIMGRKTWESIGRPLPGRENIIVTRRSDYAAKGGQTVSSLEEALRRAAGAPRIFIIGGGEIYRQALPFADRCWVTVLDHDFEGDARFPELSREDWQGEVIQTLPPVEKRPYRVDFWVFNRRRT